MAYRVKGYLTKGERDRLEQFVRNYYAIVNNVDLGPLATKLSRGSFYWIVLLAQCTLHVDDQVIMNKIVGSGKKEEQNGSSSSCNSGD